MNDQFVYIGCKFLRIKGLREVRLIVSTEGPVYSVIAEYRKFICNE